MFRQIFQLFPPKHPEFRSGEIQLGEAQHLGSGKYGDVFQFKFEGSSVALKIYRARHPFLLDLAVEEYRNTLRARDDLPELSENFVKPIGLVRHLGKNCLLTELVRNYDGKISQSMEKDRVVPRDFMNRLDELVNGMAKKGILFRVQPGNVLVRWTAPNVAEPMLIDFQGYRSFIHQPLILLCWGEGIRVRMNIWLRKLYESVEILDKHVGSGKLAA